MARPANMLCYIFVIALVVPAFCDTEPKGADEKRTICKDPSVEDDGNKVIDCVNITVNNHLTHGNKTCAIPLNEALYNYAVTVNSICFKKPKPKDPSDNKTSTSQFSKMINYSLRHDAFKEFVDKGGVKCINKIKNHITKCVRDKFDEGNENVYATMWRASKMTLNKKSCMDTYEMKKCTMTLMNDKCDNHRKGNIMMYVNSLFSYVLLKCDMYEPDWDNTLWKPDQQPLPALGLNKTLAKDTRTTHVLLGVLLTIALLGVMYVLLRDCKSTTGRWKIFNEQFEMQQRRQSLVHNEVCETS